MSAQNVIVLEGDSINRLDANQKKTGLWKLTRPEKGIVITGQLKDGEFVSNIDHYQYGKLIVSQTSSDQLIFYKGTERIYAKFTESGQSEIVAANGEPLDEEIKRCYNNVAELPPSFYGDNSGYINFLAKNVNRSRVKGHKGRVVIQFILDDNGSVQNAEVVKGENQILIDEALRLVKLIPRFQPGFQRGKFVKTKHTVPLNF